MAHAVNAGARLDRLPVSSFHYRIFWLVGAGMFFDGYDLYIAAGVLASLIQTKFSTVPQNLQFISLTFVGMTLGALITGFVGDKMGRRFTYQVNLLIFGLASLAAAFAQDMTQLIACRFVQGLGLGAEIVVGYSTLTEFVPPKTRGRWLSMMAFLVVAGFPATALLGWLIIPAFGWRPMFVIAGVGSLVVWYLRKNLPESPRWLESQGRAEEAEALMQAIETESAHGATLPPVVVPAPVAQVTAMDLLKPPLLQRLLVGCWVLITINTLIFGFVLFLPQFFLRQGLTIVNSLAYTLVLSVGSVVGCAVGAYLSDAIGRRMSIIGASVVTIVTGYIYARFHAGDDPAIVLSVGFILIVAIYVQTAILFGVYTPELFPTEIRLRANGICNTLGRGATVVSPFIVGALMASYQLPVVWAWGVEPRNRGLEDVATAKA
jgi:putative MFS transporter